MQLRNCFGLKEGEPFTKEMWDYAKRHYIHDMQGTNDIIEFFDMIEQLPEGKQAEFFKRGIQHTLSAAGGVGIGVAAYGKKKDKNNINICLSLAYNNYGNIQRHLHSTRRERS